MSNKHWLIRGVLRHWIPVAIAATAMSAFVGAVVQYGIRSSANDPQIQMAEDAAAAIDNGQDPQSVVSPTMIDLARSLAPYLIVYDDAGEPVAFSGVLDNQIPRPPEGIFAYAKQHGEDRFTWEPRQGVRSAAVVTRYSGQEPGFVLAGRSLREVEKREAALRKGVFLAWAVTLAATLVAATFVAVTLDKRSA